MERLTKVEHNYSNRQIAVSAEGAVLACYSFARESNLIEGIEEEPSSQQIAELLLFLDRGRKRVTVADLERLAVAYEPTATLRTELGKHRVSIDGRPMPPSGPNMPLMLKEILDGVDWEDPARGAWKTHVLYERLHPFSDANGRTGRALWLRLMNRGFDTVLHHSFLHQFYYETLQKAILP